jgi:hypothetical protein
VINFFRRIRQKLLTEKKFSRYLLYAFGEIVLVVIGILIALQINNWNESRKIRAQEITQLKNFQEDLSLDIPDITFNLTYHRLFLKSEEDLLHYMLSPNLIPEKPIKYENALGLSLLLILHESAFNNLRSTGPGVMSNEKLKKEISNHYDSFAKALLLFENEHAPFDTYSIKRPYFLKYFIYKESVSSKESTQNNSQDYYNPEIELNQLLLADTLGLKNDTEFEMVLAACISNTKIKIQFYENFLMRNKNLSRAIDSELRRLQK